MNKLLTTSLGFLIAIFTLMAAAIELPDIGDSSATIISPEKERQLGAGFLRRLQGYGAVLEDLETQEYLQAIGRRLVLNSDGAGQEYTFFTIAASDINAFAAPGGFIGVNAGLILNANNESELAGVLAHEISHVTQRHMARSFEQASQMSLPIAVAMIGSLLVGIANPNAGLAALTAVQAGSAQYQINFTRANEQEADRVGMALLYRAEFDPTGMPDFFERLQKANRLTDPKFYPEYLRSHPVTASRIADSQNRLKLFPPRNHKDSKAFLLARARIRVMVAKSPRQAVKIFETALKEGSYTSKDATSYGYALALGRDGKFKKARHQLQVLLKKEKDNLSYLLALAELESESGDYKKGLEIYAQLNKLYPSYKPVVMKFTETLLQANQIQAAKAILLDFGIQHGADRKYYELLAEAEGRSGSIVDSHLALAEYHYLSGDTQLASDQLTYAERSKNLDYYYKQRIQTRLEQFEKELEEEAALTE
ncbi:MAG: M48 family metalloprotease [Gammaproteobacteria bacterium]